MDQKKIFKQMMDFQKSTFDNSFNALSIFQEQGEKMIGMVMAQASWFPEEGKKAVSEWMNSYKKGREDFKAMVETNFSKVQNVFAKEEQKAE